MEDKLTMVGLTEREQYLMIMQKFIDSHGGWDLKPGRLTIDFDVEGLIKHFNISQGYDITSEMQIL